MSYAYFGDAESADNPCTAPVETTKQAELLKSEIAADPDGAGSAQPIAREYRYDLAGRVATRVTTDQAWTCTSYDAPRPTGGPGSRQALARTRRAGLDGARDDDGVRGSTSWSTGRESLRPPARGRRSPPEAPRSGG